MKIIYLVTVLVQVLLCVSSNITTPVVTQEELLILQQKMLKRDSYRKDSKIYLDQQKQRILTTSDTQIGFFTLEEHRNGAVIVYFVMCLYLAGIIYILYTKFIFTNIEEIIFLINSNQELLHPVFYCFLNSIVFLMINMLSNMVNKSNMGLSITIGSDMTNLLLLFGFIVKREYFEQTLNDSYIYFRDMVYYVLGLILLTLMMFLKTVTWYYSLIFVFYYFLYYLIQSQNDKIKQKLMLLVGATKEDDNFNSEEHFHYIKRRQSITNLIVYYNKDETQLKQAIQRTSLKPVPNEESAQIYQKFRKVVTSLIYVLRQQTKGMKQRRADFYERLFIKDKKKIKVVEGQMDMGQQEEEEGSEQGYNQDKISKQESSDSDNQQVMQQNNDNIWQDEGPAAFSLDYPRNNLFAQIMYICYFPLYLVLSTFPNPGKLEQKNKLVILSLLNLICLIVIVYFLLQWMHVIALVLSIKSETIGLTFGNFIFSAAFFNYNLKLAKSEKDIEFMQSFLQLAIFKIGMALGISYLVSSIYDSALNVIMFEGSSAIDKMGYVLLVYIAVTLVAVLLLIRKKFRFDKGIANLYIALYVLMMGVVVGLVQAI